MSMATTKAQLERLLADGDSKVIALSGRWGTGKTHMWEELCNAAQDDVVRKSLSVSLFGAASIADLKLRLVQKAVPYLSEDGLRSSSQCDCFTTRRAGRSWRSWLATSTRTRLITSRPYLAMTWNRS